jgi:hypothetical protein
MSFDSAAVATLFDKVQSHAMSLGVFESVNNHEPKSAPGNGVRAALWVQDIRPMGRASGLSATSGVVTLNVRVYSSFLQQPLDDIDPGILTAVTTLLNAYTGDFDLGASVRNVDLLGIYGAAMSAQAGYLTQDSKVYRIMTVTLPIVINDLWAQGG